MTGRIIEAQGDLRLEGVTKWYGSVRAVDGIDLVVPRGAYFTLLGPSGCGKTTTLRVVAGFETPTAGRVLLGDADLTQARPDERPVNTVFQSYALFPHLDVLGNVAFGPARRGEANAQKLAEEALELVELSALARRRPRELSGGEQQRVALARALVNKPAVLLLDEPLGALDLRLRRQMQDGLKALQHRVGTTFLHVTHDQEEAMSLADEVALIRGGRIEQQGDPRDLYDLPRSAFAATFVGRATLIPATMVGREGTGDGQRLHFDAGPVRLSVPAHRSPDGIKDGQRALVGVRPERVRLQAGTIGADDPSARPSSAAPVDLIGPGRVSAVSFTGPGTQYLVDFPHLPSWTVSAHNDGAGPTFDVGDVVHAAFPVSHAFAVAVPEGE